MKNIAVLGARGFIGQNTIKHLSKNPDYQIFPVTRNEVNLLDFEDVKKFLYSNEIDIVIHCANSGGTRKDVGKSDDVVSNNLRMFFNVERCIKNDMKFINFGSGAQYDKSRNLCKINEQDFDSFVPSDEYGFSKYVMSKYLKGRQAQKKEGFVYNLVVFGMYGIGEDYAYRFISNAIVKNLLRMPIVINQDVVFDYLYINDYFKALDYLIENDIESCEFNLTPIQSVSLSKLASIINNVSDYKSEVVIKNIGLNYEYTGDNTRLLQLMGESIQFTSYEDAIKEMRHYYQENLQNLDLETIKADALIKYCKTNLEGTDDEKQKN